MKQPSHNDKIVAVKAYLTDEVFGYEHWRATQYLAPYESRYAVLIICDNKDHQESIVKEVATSHNFESRHQKQQEQLTEVK